ncbi:MAG: tetratricopeptide repeat protein [Pirellula sp.]
MEDLFVQLVDQALAIQRKGDFASAERIYKEVISLYPNHAQPYRFLGLLYFQQRKYTESIPLLESACRLAPADQWAHYSLGTSYVWSGMPEHAIGAFDQCLKLNSDFHRARFARTMAHIPMIYTSQSEIAFWREGYAASLRSLADFYSIASLDQRREAANVIGINQTYNLAYQACDDRKLQEVYGQLICSLMATRYPHYCKELEMPEDSEDGRLRIGVLSAFFREHSNWKMPLQGWVENLDRKRFHVTCYCTSAEVDSCTLRAKHSCDHFVQGLSSIEEWADRILRDRLHVLVNPGLGMDTLIAKLACLRLAPIQCNGVGHPVTSGCETMDYYLSSDLMEPIDSAAHYSEELVKLTNLGIHYSPASHPTTNLTREAFGVGAQAMVYCCCQTLYKYLPCYDSVFPRIAQQVPNAVFLFIKHRSDHVTQTFAKRLDLVFRNHGIDWKNHCVILPRLSSADFNGLLAHSQVFLDPLDWNGMNTVMEAIHFGIPVVTLPGKYMRGRHAQAILRMIDVSETIALSEEHYVQLACQLGTDSTWRQRIQEKILAQKNRAYADMSAIASLQQFLEDSVRRFRNIKNQIG